MPGSLIARAQTIISAPATKVWDALINPAIVKQYLFGTDVHSDWQVGSDITYTGVWDGKAYEDKGKILELEPAKKLVSTYFSPLRGLPDVPENYNTVSYELAETGGETTITITQDNIGSEEEKAHSEKNWSTVLEGMKKLLEQ